MSVLSLSIPIEGISLVKVKIVEEEKYTLMLTTILKVRSHYNLLQSSLIRLK